MRLAPEPRRAPRTESARARARAAPSRVSRARLSPWSAAPAPFPRPNEFNVVQNYLKGQAGDAEQTDDSFNIDICATGFKCRYNNGNYNADGGAYVYWAFAEVPTVNSNGAPANAR